MLIMSIMSMLQSLECIYIIVQCVLETHLDTEIIIKHFPSNAKYMMVLKSSIQ